MKLATMIAPDTDYNHPEKGDALHAMEVALALEKLNFQYLYKLHKVSVLGHGVASTDLLPSPSRLDMAYPVACSCQAVVNA